MPTKRISELYSPFRRHLTPKGIFAFDIFNPDVGLLCSPGDLSVRRQVTKLIFHIASIRDWAASRSHFKPPSFQTEGFIHCSTAAQVMRVANTVFAGHSDLVLVVIDPAHVHAEIRYENLDGGAELFPHIYGPLEHAAVIATKELRVGDEGRFEAPMALDGVAYE